MSRHRERRKALLGRLWRRNRKTSLLRSHLKRHNRARSLLSREAKQMAKACNNCVRKEIVEIKIRQEVNSERTAKMRGRSVPKSMLLSFVFCKVFLVVLFVPFGVLSS